MKNFSKEKKQQKEWDSKREKMAIDVIFFKIVGDREARSRKRVPWVKNARKRTIRIELTVISSYFKGKTKRPNHQSITTLNLSTIVFIVPAVIYCRHYSLL